MSTINYVRNDRLPALWVALTLPGIDANTPGDPIDVSDAGVTVRAHVTTKSTGVLKESLVGTKTTGKVTGYTGTGSRRRPTVSTDAPYDTAGKGGIVQFFPSATTFDTEGDYEAEYEITWGDGKKQTVYEKDTIKVRKDLA